MRFLVRMGLLAILAALAGCGRSAGDVETTVVKGKLLDKGQPFKIDESKIPLPKGATGAPPGSESGTLRIVFYPQGENEQFPALFHSETSTFEVLGSGKRGIPAGKYKIAITAKFTMSATKDAGERDANDYFGGKFSREQTPIVREVKPGEEIVIDLAKPEG